MCYCVTSGMHLYMDTIPNLYSTFMCKYANMCNNVQICAIWANYVLKLQFYVIVILQLHKYGKRSLLQLADRVNKANIGVESLRNRGM